MSSAVLAVVGARARCQRPGVGAVAGLVLASSSVTAAVESAGARLVAGRWPLEPLPEVARRVRPARPAVAARAPWRRPASARSARPVRVARRRQVAFAGQLAGRGVVVVSHAGGLRSTFEPVTAGATRAPPWRKGHGGQRHRRPGSLRSSECLHWGVLRGRDYLDPLAFVEPRAHRAAPLLTATRRSGLDGWHAGHARGWACS